MPGKAAGAAAVRVDAYETRPGSSRDDCIPEQRMLAEGSIQAVTFTSTAEVCCVCRHRMTLGMHAWGMPDPKGCCDSCLISADWTSHQMICP